MARKLRFEPGANGRKKDFSWARWEDGKWLSGLGAVRPPLYRLPEIQNSSWVLDTEGEKDADAGAELGLPTTTSGGTNSWRPDHTDALRNKPVVIISDADDAGRLYAQKKAASLYGKAALVKVVEIPGSKDLAEAIEKGMTCEALVALFEETSEWKPADGAQLVHRFEGIFRDKIIAPKGASLVCALYAFMTHCYKLFSWIAYLAFLSPKESCGKSHAADIVGWASARPEILVSITEASLFRLITEEEPTIVIDEAEVLCGDGETAIAVRAILHAGNAPDDCIIRCNQKTHELERFSPFCPKIFCTIGRLPRPLASRCIAVGMKRKKASEKTGKFIRHKLKAQLRKFSVDMAVWVAQHQEEIQRVYDSLPEDSFEGRGSENFAPLEAILSVADPGRLPELQQVRLELTGVSNQDMGDDGVQLLLDIRGVFVEEGVDELQSVKLAHALVKIETSPWGDRLLGRFGNPSTAKLAALLRPFGIRPDRIGGKDSQARGYALAWFQDAFDRYIPLQTVNPSTDRENSGDHEDFKPSTECKVDTWENAVSSTKSAGGGQVDTSKAAEEGGQGEAAPEPVFEEGEV
jgi:hypothetical protein